MSAVTPIESVALICADIAAAPREQWLKLAHDIEAVKLAGYGASSAPCALAFCFAAVKLVRQMPHSHPINETELRGVARALANVILNEFGEAHPGREVRKPYYADPER